MYAGKYSSAQGWSIYADRYRLSTRAMLSWWGSCVFCFDSCDAVECGGERNLACTNKHVHSHTIHDVEEQGSVRTCHARARRHTTERERERERERSHTWDEIPLNSIMSTYNRVTYLQLCVALPLADRAEHTLMPVCLVVWNLRVKQCAHTKQGEGSVLLVFLSVTDQDFAEEKHANLLVRIYLDSPVVGSPRETRVEFASEATSLIHSRACSLLFSACCFFLVSEVRIRC
jgi:hypothetical protein